MNKYYKNNQQLFAFFNGIIQLEVTLQDRTGQQGDTRRLNLDRFEIGHNLVNFEARKM